MRTRLIKTVPAAAAVVLALAGCSDSRAGTPTASGTDTTSAGDTTDTTKPSGGPSTPGSDDRHGAPPVANPLDATKFLAQPCAALTPQQLQGFNLPAQGRPDTDSAVAKHAGPSCKWNNSDTATGIVVSFVKGNTNGLADVYAARERGRWQGYWEETTVAGYPAVFTFETDARPQGDCNMFVGTSDTLAFAVGTSGRLKEKSCDLAKQIAAAVVETWKRGG